MSTTLTNEEAQRVIDVMRAATAEIIELRLANKGLVDSLRPLVEAFDADMNTDEYAYWAFDVMNRICAEATEEN